MPTPTVPTVELSDSTRIPQFGLGVWQIPDDEVTDVVLAAFEAGYRHIDTAAIYGNEAGVGRAIAQSGLARDELYVTTKLWNDRHTDAPAALAESLEKLGLDSVDLYLTHWPTTHGTHTTAWESLVALRAEGLTRSIGVSNHTADQLSALVETTGVTPVLNQIECHPTFAQRELVAAQADLGIATEAWSPLGQSKDLTAEAVTSIAARLGATPAQVVLAWHLAQGRIVFPKSANPERVVENLGALEVTLSDEDLAAIDALDEGNRLGPDPAAFSG